MAQIKIGAIITLIVAIECGAALFLLPSAEEVAAKAADQVASDIADEAEAAIEGEMEVESEPVTEVELGTFTVTSYQPSSNVTMRIDFFLFGTVLDEDVSEFEDLFTKNQLRLQDKIIITTRNSEVNDLTDPSLGLLKRRILDTANRALGGPILRDIGFGNFSFIEQ